MQEALANTKTTTATRTLKTGAKQRPTLFSTLCWHIFLPLLHERPNAPLQRRKHTTTKFLCISKHGPQKFNSRKNHLHLIAMKLERWPIHFISDILAVVAVLVSCGRVTAKFTCLSPSKSRNFTEGHWLGKGAQTFFQRSKVCKNFATFLSFQQITLTSFTFLFGFQGAKREIFAREETENKKTLLSLTLLRHSRDRSRIRLTTSAFLTYA